MKNFFTCVCFMKVSFIIRLKDEILRFQYMKDTYNEPVDDLILFYEKNLNKVKSSMKLPQDKRFTDFFAIAFLEMKHYGIADINIYDSVFNEFFESKILDEMIEYNKNE